MNARPPFNRHALVVAISAALAWSISSPAAAVDWDNPDTGDWFTDSNWFGDVAPTSTDLVWIDNGGTAQVRSTGATALNISIGNSSNGALEISNGGTLDNDFSFIGRADSGTGTVTVTDVGSVWNSEFRVTIGNSGTGILTIEAGGEVNSRGGLIGKFDGSSGAVTVTGGGSLWDNGLSDIDVGDEGEGELTIANGGTVINGEGYIGRGADSTGTVTVTGAGSTWDNSSSLRIGESGVGSLTIENGGHVENVVGNIGFNTGSTGAVTVTGTDSTWVNGAGLFVGDSGEGTLTINDGGRVDNTEGRIGNSSSANGEVTVTGAGSIWDNESDLIVGESGDGTLTIADGGRVDNSDGIISAEAGSTGSVTVTGMGSLWNNSAEIEVGGSGNGTLTLADRGRLNATGSTGEDTVTLAGQATSTGTLNIGNGGAAGVLNATEVDGGPGEATLNFNHTDDNYFFTRDGAAGGDAIAITGSTAVNHIGSGTTTLTGTNTYTGDTTINDGLLVINGALLNSAITIDGGSLGGDGILGTVGFGGASGAIAPGNSIGTTNVANIDFTGGGVYEVEVDAAGNSDLIAVSGTATLTDGRVSVLPMPGDYNLSTTYSILQADTIDGRFDAVSVDVPDFAFLDPSLAYSANEVELTLERNDVSFDAVAGTPNQRAVGSLVERLSMDNPGAIDPLLGNLAILTAEDANQAYDSLSGVQHTQAQAITSSLNSQFQSLLFGRLGGHGSVTSGDLSQTFSGERWAHQLDASFNSLSSLQGGDDSAQHGLWLRSFGGVGEIDDTANASGADYKSGGLAVGFDTQWSENLMLGVATGYARSDADTANGQLDIDSYQVAGYGRWTEGDDYLGGSLGGAWHQTDADRGVSVGTFDQRAEADYDSYNLTAALEAGRHFDLGEATVTPFAGLEYSYLNRDAFTERGAGVANLEVEDASQDSLRSRLGVRLSHAATWDNGVRIEPTVEAAYVREYLDDTANLDAGFAAAPGASFQIDGPELDRNRWQLGAGFAAHLSPTSSLNVAYQTELAGSDERHHFAATYKMLW